MRSAAAVFLLATLALGFHLHLAGVATGFIDPVGRVRSQDEAVYAHSAIRMAQTAHWLTPGFMGRHALYKPPLLFWLSGLSVGLLGPSPLSLRIPSLLAGALAAALLFAWLRPSVSLPAAAAAALLLVSNPLFHRVSRRCLTDALLALCLVAAMYALSRDPSLARRRSFWAFSALSAAAILAKGIAGLLPLLILLWFALLRRRGDHPSARRIAQTALLTAALAAPWFLYQLAVHPRWFWAEFIGGEIFTFGLASPYQTSSESPVVFYLHRLFFTDPLLCLLALTALPALRGAGVQPASRCHPPTLLLSWAAVVSAAMLLFQYRNASYLSLLVPVLALIAVAYGPLFSGRRATVAAAALGLVFLIKAASPLRLWGLDFRAGTTVAAAPVLDAYARMHRPNELILVSPDDEFYSAVLPLPRIRYCFIDPADSTPSYGPDFRYLGIHVTAAQFLDLDRWRPVFRQRLRTWNLDADEPLATALTVRSPAELAALIAASSRSDFFLPTSLRAALEPPTQATHRAFLASPDYFFLLTRP